MLIDMDGSPECLQREDSTASEFIPKAVLRFCHFKKPNHFDLIASGSFACLLDRRMLVPEPATR
jgi:hypothetical protein